MAKAESTPANGGIFKYRSMTIVIVGAAALAVSIMSFVGALSLVFMSRAELRKEYVTRTEYERECTLIRAQAREHYDDLIRQLERTESNIMGAIRNGGD
jgi:hypothetical protein